MAEIAVKKITVVWQILVLGIMFVVLKMEINNSKCLFSQLLLHSTAIIMQYISNIAKEITQYKLKEVVIAKNIEISRKKISKFVYCIYIWNIDPH